MIQAKRLNRRHGWLPELIQRFLLASFLIVYAASSATAQTIAGTASVIDGDTIEIHGQRIRLHAIDAIESRQRCLLLDGRTWNCGRDSARALAEKIGRASVSCRVKGIDRYQRYVAVCTQKGEDLNAWMVLNGWAVAYRRYGMDYVNEEARARKAKTGIWGGKFVMPWDWRRGLR
ncbi:thermonuclease family protein [Sinorhodobacter sp. B57]|nr:thermonuclease family protein [Sedimentimonas flavescens]